MNTDIAIPEEPEDRCHECRTTFQFHLEHPQGVRYVKFQEPMKHWVITDQEPRNYEPVLDVHVCYVYKIGPYGRPFSRWEYELRIRSENEDPL